MDESHAEEKGHELASDTLDLLPKPRLGQRGLEFDIPPWAAGRQSDMTHPEYEVVVTLVEGDSREPLRSFKSGAAVAPLSVGPPSDWLVSADAVASVHLWLRFDGVGLCAASVGGGELSLEHGWGWG